MKVFWKVWGVVFFIVNVIGGAVVAADGQYMMATLNILAAGVMGNLFAPHLLLPHRGA